MTYKNGTWRRTCADGSTEEVTGRWCYYRPSDVFRITLDSTDPVTGETRRVTSHEDAPEWGEWKLVRP